MRGGLLFCLTGYRLCSGGGSGGLCAGKLIFFSPRGSSSISGKLADIGIGSNWKQFLVMRICCCFCFWKRICCCYDCAFDAGYGVWDFVFGR